MKPKTTPEKAVPPKRRISRWEKEWKRRRLIAALVIVVILAAGGIVGYGWYDTHYKPWHQAVVKVNGQVFDMNYFVKMLRLYGAENNPTQITQIAQYAIGTIQSNEVVRQKAEEYGVYADDITDDEIEEEMRTQLGFDPESESEEEFHQRVEDTLDELGVSKSTLEKLILVPYILRDKLFEAIGNDKYPRDEKFEYAQIKAVLAGTEEEALEIKDKWGGDFNQIIKDYSPTGYYPYGGYWLVMVYEPEETEEYEEEGRYIQAILVATEEKADEIADKFDGSNFAELAETYSLDSSSTSGGDMGWMSLDDIESKFGDLETIQDLELNIVSDPISENYPDGPFEWLPAGILSSVFDGVVFAEGSETSGVSDPVRDTTYTTPGGYWLVMVYEPEETGEQEEEGLYIKAMLLDSKKQAEDIAAEFDGSNFATLAEENSLDSSAASGGDMGWMSLDSIESKFGEDYVDDIQNLALDTPSDPIPDEDVSKQSSYWLIEVLSKEDRFLTDDDWDTLSQKVYSEILETAMDESEIKNYLEDDPGKLDWALEHL